MWSALAEGARAADGDNVAQRVGPVGGRGWSLRTACALHSHLAPVAAASEVRELLYAALVRALPAAQLHVGTAQAEVKMCAFLLEKCLEDTTGGRELQRDGWAQFLTAHASLAESYDLHVITPQWPDKQEWWLGESAADVVVPKSDAADADAAAAAASDPPAACWQLVLVASALRHANVAVRRWAAEKWMGAATAAIGKENKALPPAARRFVLGPLLSLLLSPDSYRTTDGNTDDDSVVKALTEFVPACVASLAAGAAAAKGATAARGDTTAADYDAAAAKADPATTTDPYADAAAFVASLVGQLTRTAPAQLPAIHLTRAIRTVGASEPNLAREWRECSHGGLLRTAGVLKLGSLLREVRASHAHWSIDAVSSNALLGLIALGAPREIGLIGAAALADAAPSHLLRRAAPPGRAPRRTALAKKLGAWLRNEKGACGADGWLTSQLRAAAATYLMAAEPAGSLRRLVDFNVGGSAEEAEAGAAAMVEALKEAEVEATRLGTAAWFVGWDEMVETMVAPLCARLAHVSSHAYLPPLQPPRLLLLLAAVLPHALDEPPPADAKTDGKGDGKGDADDDADADAKDDGKKDERRQRLVKYLGGCAEEVAACVGDCVRSLRALAFLPEKEGGGTSAAAKWSAARTVCVVGAAAAAAAAVPEAGWLGALSGATLEQLAELLKHDNAAVRSCAADALARLGHALPLPLPTALPPKAGAAAVPHPEWLAAYQSLRNATLAVQQLVLAEKSPPTSKDGAAAPLDGAWAALEPLLRRGGAVGGGQAAVAPLARALAAAYPQCAESDAKLLRSLLGCHRLLFIGAAADAPPPKGKDDGVWTPESAQGPLLLPSADATTLIKAAAAAVERAPASTLTAVGAAAVGALLPPAAVKTAELQGECKAAFSVLLRLGGRRPALARLGALQLCAELEATPAAGSGWVESLVECLLFGEVDRNNADDGGALTLGGGGGAADGFGDGFGDALGKGFIGDTRLLREDINDEAGVDEVGRLARYAAASIYARAGYAGAAAASAAAAEKPGGEAEAAAADGADAAVAAVRDGVYAAAREAARGAAAAASSLAAAQGSVAAAEADGRALPLAASRATQQLVRGAALRLLWRLPAETDKDAATFATEVLRALLALVSDPSKSFPKAHMPNTPGARRCVRAWQALCVAAKHLKALKDFNLADAGCVWGALRDQLQPRTRTYLEHFAVRLLLADPKAAPKQIDELLSDASLKRDAASSAVLVAGSALLHLPAAARRTAAQTALPQLLCWATSTFHTPRLLALLVLRNLDPDSLVNEDEEKDDKGKVTKPSKPLDPKDLGPVLAAAPDVLKAIKKFCDAHPTTAAAVAATVHLLEPATNGSLAAL